MDWQGEALIAGFAGSAIYGLYRAVTHPQSTLFGAAFHCGREGRRHVALTFDDGPDPVWTPRIAAVLRQFRIPGTFFCIGRHAEIRPELVRALHDDGHEIGNHSYSHKNLWFRSPAQVREEIERCQKALSDIVSTPPLVFRPPFGDRGPQVVSEARKLKLNTVLWSLDSKDWKSPPAGALLSRVQRQTHDGAVLLFHDGSHNGRFSDRSSTVTAVAGLVPWFRLRGFEFVTVSQLMADGGETS